MSARPRPRLRAQLRGALGALAVLVALLPAPAGGTPIRDPIQVRIEGYIDATEQQVNPWAMFDIWLERAPDRRFALTNLIVLSPGNVSGPDIFAAVQPLHPNIILNGEPALLEKISTALPNQYLQITGYTAFGPQRILIIRVERSEPIIGPTPTPSWSQRLFGF